MNAGSYGSTGRKILKKTLPSRIRRIIPTDIQTRNRDPHAQVEDFWGVLDVLDRIST